MLHSEPCSREFFADEVATSTEAAPGNGIIASSFFRASERNVRHFCGRWFFAGLGLHPAGVLLFRNHALLSSLGLFRSYAPESFFADEVATSTEAAPGNCIMLGFCCFATTLY